MTDQLVNGLVCHVGWEDNGRIWWWVGRACGDDGPHFSAYTNMWGRGWMDDGPLFGAYTNR